MTRTPASRIPELWVTVLAGDSVDAEYLHRLSERQGLPVGALLLEEGASADPKIGERLPDAKIRPLFPATLSTDGYWSLLLSRAADVAGAVFVVRAGTEVPEGGWRRLE